MLLLTLLAQPACAGSSLVPPTASPRVVPRQTVIVWRDDAPVALSAVRFDADSVSGVPPRQPGACDTCRVSVPRAEIDSIRIRHGDAGAIAFGMAPFAALVGLGLLFHATWGDD